MKQRSLLVTVLLATAFLIALGMGRIWAQESVPQGDVSIQAAVGTDFTYQGRLTRDGHPVNGTCDFQFTLWDAATGGHRIGSPQTKAGVQVTNGLFNVQLDFGRNAFQGEARWLQVAVRCPAGSGSYTTLTPRQPVTSVPYAMYALSAPWNGLTGVPAGFADGVDNDTQYRAGTGLTLVGNEFRLRTPYRLPQGCNNGQVPKWNGSTWQCGNDETGSGSYWSLTGNAGTNPETDFLGTTDNVTLTLRVNNTIALRLGPTGDTPNVIGGYSGNSVANGVRGATISGGGVRNEPNRITANYGTIGGGAYNTVSGPVATVGGGSQNEASGTYATVGGGHLNQASGAGAFVGGGGCDGPVCSGNLAQAPASTIAGGMGNKIASTASYATVSGGSFNQADGEWAAVGGGGRNKATGVHATIPGGRENEASGDYSFAAGYKAKARHQGAFVWADSINAEFSSDRADQFKVRARGGVHFTVSSSGLNPPGVKIEQTSNAGVGLFIIQRSSDAGLVITNKGSGDLLKAFSTGGNLRFRVSNSGEVYADGHFHSGGADFAEMMPAGEPLEPGDVLVVGADGKLHRSRHAYDTRVVGVYSTRPGFVGGQGATLADDERIPLAVVGVVPVKASAENGPIHPGDLLVSAQTPGHAMKAGATPPVGTVIGKALQGLEEGTGTILMLVMLR